MFVLKDQIKRASTSIVLNIAEGSVGLGDQEFKRFLKIALHSLYKTVSYLKIAERLFHIEINHILIKYDIIGKELISLIKSKDSQANKKV